MPFIASCACGCIHTVLRMILGVMYRTQYLEVGQGAFDQSVDSQDKHPSNAVGHIVLPPPIFLHLHLLFFAIFRCFLREHERRASRLSLRSDLLQILPFRTPNLTTKTLGPASRTTDHWSEMGLDPRGSRSSTFTHRVDSAQGISRTCCCC